MLRRGVVVVEGGEGYATLKRMTLNITVRRLPRDSIPKFRETFAPPKRRVSRCPERRLRKVRLPGRELVVQPADADLIPTSSTFTISPNLCPSLSAGGESRGRNEIAGGRSQLGIHFVAARRVFLSCVYRRFPRSEAYSRARVPNRLMCSIPKSMTFGD